MLQFDIQQEPNSIIKVIGVGGGGSNAVNHMYKLGIKGVDFIVCNTDNQALHTSPVPKKIQLGATLAKGLGAGSIPEVGKNSALETIDEVRKYLSNDTQMVFITAGLGGGTGTGAAPIIASVAREMGILTVGIVTIPFTFEGKKRRMQAEQGLEEIKKYVDTLLVISNDKLREMYGNLKMSEAFAHADNVLASAAKSIAEVISLNLHINVDFNDVKTVMKDSGVAIMGTASASGEKRALKAVQNALLSPLLNDNDIRGSRHVLLNIMSGTDDISMDEFGEITDYIQEESGYTAELITGYGIDPSLGDCVNVTIIATGFQSNTPTGFEPPKVQEKKVTVLDTPMAKEEIFIPAPQVIQTKLEAELESENAVQEEPFLIIKDAVQPIAEVEQQEIVEPIAEVESEIEMTSELEITEPEFIITNLYEETEAELNIESVEEEISYENPVAEENTIEEEIKLEIRETTAEVKTSLSEDDLEKFEREERIRSAQERIKKLKELSIKLKTPEGLIELEKEPSFVRQDVKLSNTPHSSESQVSRYTLSEGEDNKMEIRPNNSFLHDNVD